MLGLGIWTTISGISNAFSMFLNGANILLLQVVCGLIMAISALVAKIWLAHAIGLAGIIWGTIIAHFLFCAIPFAIYTPNLLISLRDSKKMA